MIQIKKIILSLTFLCVFQLLCLADSREHNILILHSYHQGLEWTDHISTGILEVFKDRTDVNLVFEYLDAKRNFNEEYNQQLYELYKTKAREIPFEAIIISDNAAFNFMLKYKDEFYPNIPVIYCGVNNLDTATIAKKSSFFGIGEKADHYGTINAIKTVFPNRKKILIINDNTLTGKNIRVEVDQVIKEFEDELEFEFESEFTLNSLQEKVRNLDDNYAIYLLVLNRDKNNNFISYKKGATKLSEVSAVPLFGSWDFYENKGIVGGKITRGIEQGRHVAKMAEKIIDGASWNDLPKYDFLKNNYVFDHNQMNRFGITQDKLPTDSIIINKPNRDSKLLYITLGIILILTLSLLLLLLRLNIKKKRMLNMEKLIEERTCELKKANEELSEIITAKNKFFSILAHDLRSSIGLFQSYAGLLNEKESATKDKSTARLIENLQIVANQTFGIVEDLLYWGYNQFNKKKNIDITNFNLAEVIDSIVDKSRFNLGNVGFNLSIDKDLKINSDENICSFILRNIIQNALKFSKDNGIIDIKALSDSNSITVTVKDYGMGMSRDIINSIFDKQPVKRTGQRGQKSMGMGLSTVLDYLKAIEGNLEITSEPEKGSEFRIIFPDLQ